MDTLYSQGPYVHIRLTIRDSGTELRTLFPSQGKSVQDTTPVDLVVKDTGWVRPDSQKMEIGAMQFFLYYFTQETDPYAGLHASRRQYRTESGEPGQYFLSRGDTLLYCERYDYDYHTGSGSAFSKGSRFFQKDLGLLRYADWFDWWGSADSTRLDQIRFNGKI